MSEPTVEVPLSKAIEVPALRRYVLDTVTKMGFPSIEAATAVLTGEAAHQRVPGGKRTKLRISRINEGVVDCHEVDKGSFRTIPVDRVQIHAKGPRGGRVWTPLPELLEKYR